MAACSDPLHDAVVAMLSWPDARGADRAACRDALLRMQRNMQEAEQIYARFLQDETPAAPRSGVTPLIDAAGAKRLYDLHIDQKAAARRVSELTGAALIDAFDLDDCCAIELAYRRLELGETRQEAAQRHLDRQRRRSTALGAALARLPN